MSDETKDTSAGKMHSLYLHIVLSSEEQLTIAVPKISSDPRKSVKKILKAHTDHPVEFFAKVMTLNLNDSTYDCNGEQIVSNAVGAANTFLSYFEKLKTTDPSMSYMEIYRNGVRATSISDKRKIFNNAYNRLTKCSNSDIFEMFKRENNTIHICDILDYLNNNIVRAVDDPSRYREQLKKIWQQLVTASTVLIDAGQGDRITNGIVLHALDNVQLYMSVRLFVYLETPDIHTDPMTICTALQNTNELHERHTEMTTLVFESTHDYEFFDLIVSGLFQMPMWKCYGNVHYHVDSDDIPLKWDSSLSIFRHDPFRNTNRSTAVYEDKWIAIDERYLQYHLYLIRCMETNNKEVEDYVDYIDVVRNEGFGEKKVIEDQDISSHHSVNSEYVNRIISRQQVEDATHAVYELKGDPSNPKVVTRPQEKAITTRPESHEGRTSFPDIALGGKTIPAVFDTMAPTLDELHEKYTKVKQQDDTATCTTFKTNDDNQFDFSRYEGKLFVPPHDVLFHKQSTDNKEQAPSLNYTFGTSQFEMVHRITLRCAEIGVSKEFLSELQTLLHVHSEHMDVILSVVELFAKHPTHNDDMLKAIQYFMK